MNKPFIIFDDNKLNSSSVIIVIGGDGFMLKTLIKLYKFKKPFYGINSGDYGFLMNKFHDKNIIKNIYNTDLVKISPLLSSRKSKVLTIKSTDVLEITAQWVTIKLLAPE